MLHPTAGDLIRIGPNANIVTFDEENCSSIFLEDFDYALVIKSFEQGKDYFGPSRELEILLGNTICYIQADEFDVIGGLNE